MIKDLSVVVCTKNEEKRLEDCLRSIVVNEPREIIVVDGGSTDRTIEIAKKYATRVISSENSNISRDRQIGIDAAQYPYIAMIDSDHRLKKGDLQSLLNDLQTFNYDIVQSQLISYKNLSFWNEAEEEVWDLTHNIPGPKRVIGVAPAIFKRSVFDKVRFDDRITKTIDDTDFMYKVSKHPEIKIGIGNTRIMQLHFGSFKSYVKKYLWYGRGNGEFIVKNPNRFLNHSFHLLVRYPVIYTFRAIRKRKFKAIPLVIMQGYLRFYGMIAEIIRLKLFSKTKG